jgi:UDP-glucose 4-epimerase
VRADLDGAAHIQVGESVQNPSKYYRNNIENAVSD